MVINFKRTVAYMCPSCGEMTFADFSLFELSGERGISVSCGCQKSQLKIFPKTKEQYVLSLRCLLCDELHEYPVSLQDLLKKSCMDFACPQVLIGLAFVGKSDAVSSRVKENTEYINEIVSTCGLSHTGKNGVTMLKALDKIQQLSDDSNLFCECGSNIIDVDVLEDEIILECCMCKNRVSFMVDEIRNGSFLDITEIEIKKNSETTDDKESLKR